MYAQINYSQKLGNGPYTIAEAGCLLTAQANLAARFGNPVDPPTLNNFFLQHNKYSHDPSEPAGTVDDLTWGSITAYDSHIVSVSFGSGWPNNNDAILEVRYTGPRTGKITTHFVLCVDHVNQIILDSYDGQVKKNPYGTPVAYAIYERQVAQVVTPPPPHETPAFTIENVPTRTEELKVTTHLWDLNQRSWPGLVNNPAGSAGAGTTFQTDQIAHHILGGSYFLPVGSANQGYNVVDCETPPAPAAVPAAPAAPSPPALAGAMTVPGGKPYSLIVAVRGYLTATAAGNHDESKKFTDLGPGDYYIFNVYPKRPDLINLTKKDGTPGAWINTADNALPPPPPPPGPLPEAERARIQAARSPEPPAPVPAPAPAAPSWQDSYVPFPFPVKYTAVRDIVVQDLSGQHPDMLLPQYDFHKPNVGVVSAYGRVTKDGVTFYRLKTNNDPDFEMWYSVPVLDPATNTPLLLVMPPAVAAPIVSKMTATRDTLQLTRARLENDGLKLLDDIIPKWFKNKK